MVVIMALYACKKEYIEPRGQLPPNDNVSVVQDEAMSIVGKINNFKNRMSIAQSQASRNNDYISIDSVVWNIATLFNASYTFPDLGYEKTISQELLFYVPVNNNVVAMKDVAILYDKVVAGVRNAYSNDGISKDKSLKNVFFEKGDIENNCLEIRALVLSGQSSPDNPGDIDQYYIGPFTGDDCWYYGEYGGACNNPSLLGDAAEAIEYWVNYYYGCSPSSKAGHRNIYVTQSMIHLQGNEFVKPNGEYYIYYWYNNDDYLYLNASLLNYYYHNEVDVVMELVPNSPEYISKLPSNVTFMELDLQGNSSSELGVALRKHDNFILYGSKVAVPVQVLGKPADLLQ